MPPRELLGWGSSLQVDFGEIVQGSLGVSGNMPLHLIAFDNCGPSVTMGGGVSALPGDVAGAITYTWNVAQI